MAAAPSILEELEPFVEPPLLTLVPGLQSPDLWAVEQKIAEAERLVEVNRHEEAAAVLDGAWRDAKQDPALALRHLLTLSWVEMYRGRLVASAELVERAESIARLPRFDAIDRAEVIFRKGCIALKSNDVAEASSLFTRALDMNERSSRPSPRLAARVRERRARCHVLRRDWDAAQRDVERSLAASESSGEELLRAHSLLQAGIVAERQHQWLLARCSTEQALAIYEAHDDPLSTARTLNNLGCLHFLLGDVEEAERTLEEAVGVARRAGSEADVAQASSSLAQVYVRTGRTREGRARATAAAALLADRDDFLDELGNAQLVVAKALAAEGDAAGCRQWLGQAEETFTRLGSASHLAAVWIEHGDLVRNLGDVETAAALYRRSAEVLQDFHF